MDTSNTISNFHYFDILEEAIVILDPDLKILNSNRAFNALFGLEHQKNDLISFPGLITTFDKSDKLISNLKNVLQSKKGFNNLHIEIETTSEEKKFFDVTCNLLNHSDDNKNILIVIHEITKLKEAEREREDVLNFIAHEVRTPLANLSLCIELLSEYVKENNENGINDTLQDSKRNLIRLNKIITNLYDAARAESGNLKLDLSTFNFAELIEEATNTVKALHPSHTIISSGDANIGLTADRYLLMQAITNLLNNAIKYSAENTAIQVNIMHDANIVTVSVEDEGPGISPKHLPFIFERFFRADKVKQTEGLGLGLYFCRQVIFAHNGKIWAQNKETGGAIFYFTIPIHQSSN